MPTLTVEQLYFYPVKSLRGVPLNAMALDDFGAAGDRRWMIVDQHGKFVTQRERPQLAQITASISGQCLQITLPDHYPMTVAPGTRQRTVSVWHDDVWALSAQPGPSDALSDWLGEAVELVYMPDDSVRPVDPAFDGRGARVSFADGFPFLIAHQASLDALSRRVGSDLDMRRFRPNIVVSGGEAFAEDHWPGLVSASGVRLQLVKPCGRCVMTTVDPDTGEKAPDRQPLRELGQFRRSELGVLFGINAIHTSGQLINVGDQFEVEPTEPTNNGAQRISR